MNDITLSQIALRIVRFRDERNWKQFHTPKDMILSLILEAAELAEHAQWRSEAEFMAALSEHREEIGDELADLLYWVVLLAHDLEVDLSSAFERKMQTNESKYPVEKARNSSKKYDQF